MPVFLKSLFDEHVTSNRFLKIYKYFCVLIFGLIALGGAVRAMNAGLSCPDWPLCFGQIIPDYHPQVYFEFIHRVIAGLVSILALALNLKIIFSTSSKGSTALVTRTVKWVAGGALFLLVAQIVMGGLTVLLQLHDKIVAGHLALGTGFFALTFWVYLTLSHKRATDDDAHVGRYAAVFMLVAVYVQILLGGLVASNYAALVCTEFPLCHGEFIPTLHGIIGLHIVHRLGAYTLATIIVGASIFIFRRVKNLELRKWARAALILVFVQICIGICNVLFLTPPLITVLHLATGVSLFAVAIRMVRLTTAK